MSVVDKIKEKKNEGGTGATLETEYQQVQNDE